MKLPAIRNAVLLAFVSLALPVALTGCSDEDKMTQEEIRYLSHLDQSRFFQRQGELKASTLEARSAIELQPGKPEPYFVIIDNLLTAGDALNAERQLARLLEDLPADNLTSGNRNKAQLIRAEAHLMQHQFDEALTALDALESPDRVRELEAALLKGRILLAAARFDDARSAYQQARELDNGSALPLVGLSRVAWSSGDRELASSLISEAEQVDANDAELWLWKAQVADAQQQWQIAEDAYIRALEDIGQYDVMTYRKYETISALIRVLRAQGKSAEAFVYEEILAKSAPGTIKSNLAAARAALEESDLEGAARYLEEILAQAPDHQQSALMLGLVRFRQGRTEEAEALLAPIAEPGESEAANKLLAATRLQLRDPEGARKVLDGLEEKQSDPEILALVGIASLASGDVNAGEEFIEASLAKRPENHTLRLRYAGYLLRQGKPDKAIEQARMLIDTAAVADDARTLIIQSYLASNDPDAARESANAWVKQAPDSVRALVTRGELAARDKDYGEAARYYTEAARKAPDNPAPLIAAGQLALIQQDPDAARQAYRKAAMLAPDNRQAMLGITRVLEGDELQQFMAEVLEAHPDAIGPRLVLLEMALDSNDSNRADELTATLLERESENQPARAEPLVAALYHSMAVRKRDAGNLSDARNLLNRGRILFPDNLDIALQSAALAFAENEAGEAREVLQDARLKHPESGRPFLVEATYEAEQGRHKEAAEMFRLALDKERNASTELAYARELQRAGDPEKAISSLESAMATYPGDPRLPLTIALFAQDMQQNERATAAYLKVLEIDGDNTLALNNLAWIYHEAGDERALELAEKAYRLNPDSAPVADTYGWILFSAGRHQESVPVLEKAYQLEPQTRDIILHLAEAYEATGQQDKAAELKAKM